MENIGQEINKKIRIEIYQETRNSTEEKMGYNIWGRGWIMFSENFTVISRSIKNNL